MIALLLLLAFPQPFGVDASHTMDWDRVTSVVEYRVYTAEPGGTWVLFDVVPQCSAHDERCGFVFDELELPGTLVFLTVSSSNLLGEGSHGHGAWAGEGLE